ncbi:hypothetical protein [Streptomyces hokutonensis]|nr:hypothetical protein [Streptomyces hokutonensis]
MTSANSGGPTTPRAPLRGSSGPTGGGLRLGGAPRSILIEA